MKTIIIEKNTNLVTFENGLVLTPWHPIKDQGEWKFPAELKNE